MCEKFDDHNIVSASEEDLLPTSALLVTLL